MTATNKQRKNMLLLAALTAACSVESLTVPKTVSISSRPTAATTTTLWSSRYNRNNRNSNFNDGFPNNGYETYSTDYVIGANNLRYDNRNDFGDRYGNQDSYGNDGFDNDRNMDNRYNNNDNRYNNNRYGNNNNDYFNNNNDMVMEDNGRRSRFGVTPSRPMRPILNTNSINEDNSQFLNEETNGGYTVKQRLREEAEFPFRTVRLVLFGGATASALTALYFSLLNTIKAYVGGYADAPPLQECLQNDAINIGAAAVCAFLAIRDWNAGKNNLDRIQTGGKLAKLTVEPASAVFNYQRFTLADFRRKSRVLICAGGESYLRKLALSLASDQLSDTNILPQRLAETDVIVVPVLLTADNFYGDDNYYTSNDLTVSNRTPLFWNSIQAYDIYDDTYRPELSRNFDISRADEIVAFPRNAQQWQDYLQQEVQTAESQGFNVLEQGITVTIKKNGKVLRRATGLPPWGELINTLEVADGSKFGMPGDSQRYGGP